MTCSNDPSGAPNDRPDPTGIWAREAPSSFHVMAKPTGAICNLDCQYCYFLSKEALYPGSRFRMSDEVLEAYIRQVIGSQASGHVTIAWQGGEPTLMGLPFFQRAMELVTKHLRAGMTLEHTLQTNGTLLDDAWCRFLRDHHFLVGLSMDGPRRLHDVYRVDKAGQPTFERVMQAARRLQRHGVALNYMCSVNAANAEHPLEVYRFFRDALSAEFVQFIPIVERRSPSAPASEPGDDREAMERVSERSVGPEQWGRFLNGVFDEWVHRDVGRVFVQTFESALAAWCGLPPTMCVFAETCGQALALEHNGDLYSCDHFVEPAYLLGNITETPMRELVGSERQRAFGQAKRDTLPAYCRACSVRFACNGECPRNRFRRAPDGEAGLNYLCAGYKAFFTHVDPPMRIMAALLARGRHPSGVMPLLAQAEGRSAPLA